MAENVKAMEPGSLFGPYRIQDKLGEGGMGVVYRALDTSLQRQVAIKTLLGSPDADATARFLREAKAASRLQHTSVVTIYHIGVESGTPYIVMELVEGNTLKKVIGGRPMALRHACDVAIQTCEGLAAAHEMGVIHRDIKAENIIITPRGAVKILDFGLAKLTEAVSEDGMTIAQTQAGVVMGTVSHMSPEQALGRDVDTRTDLFSFGVVLYEMLTGRTPFQAQTAQAILARVLHHTPDPVSQSNPAVGPELEQVVVDCLQKDRELRPSAVEVLAMLKSVRDALSRAAGGAGGSSPNVVLPASRVATTLPAGAALGSQRPAMPTAVGSGAVAATRVASGATETAQPQAASNVTVEMQATYWALRVLKVVVSAATLSVPLAFVLSFLIGGGAIRPEIVQDTIVQRFMDAVVGPVLETAGKVLTFRTVVDGWNLLLPVMAIIAMVFRRLVTVPFLRAERWAKARISRMTKTETRGASISTAPKVTDQRMAMLREYAETKKLLFQQKRRLAFVSIDVVNAARLKAGEDKLVLEHAFAEYRKYAERVLTANNVWKHTWQGETATCAFFTIDTAVRAAQQMVAELAWFNDGIHQLRHKFEVRCGVSIGDVVFPEDRRIEDVSDEALDLAVALRNRAPANAVWVAAEALTEVGDASAFTRLDDLVSGQEARQWTPGAESAIRPAEVRPIEAPTMAPLSGAAPLSAMDDSGPTVVGLAAPTVVFPSDDVDATIGPAPRR